MSTEKENVYLLNEDLYNMNLIAKLIQEGKDKKLCVCFDPYMSGVAYTESGEYMSYSTNERAVPDRFEMHPTFLEAISGAQEKYEGLQFELDYVNKRIKNGNNINL